MHKIDSLEKKNKQTQRLVEIPQLGLNIEHWVPNCREKFITCHPIEQRNVWSKFGVCAIGSVTFSSQTLLYGQ